MLRKAGSFVTNNQKFLPLSATILLFFATYLAGAFVYPSMRDPQVFFNLFRASPFLLISGVGMTLVILSGGIDLSVSGIVALTSVATAALLRDSGLNPWVIILLMLVMGMTFGVVMGAFITYLKVQPFIATLAGMWFARGLCFFISDDAIVINNRIFRILGLTKILIPGLSNPAAKTGDFISILVVVAMTVFVLGIFFAHYTRFGRTVYAMGGNEASAGLMGLSVNATKMMVYTLNGFCSALAGIAYCIYVMSGHGLYASGFEMTVIAAVVIGGTMLTGGEGYVFGTLFGTLIIVLIQTLIQFNGKLSSWWTNIVVGLLMLVFIGVQSLLAARKSRMQATQKRLSQAKAGVAPLPETAPPRAGLPGVWDSMPPRNRQMLLLGGGAVILVLGAATFGIRRAQNASLGSVTESVTQSALGCTLKPFRQDQADSHVQAGALIAYERNGGSGCIDELFAIYPDGRIIADDGVNKIEKQVAPDDVDKLVAGIRDRGWFTEEMYSTWHNPCGQCFGYYLTVSYNGQQKTVKAVDGGTDAPANYWQVVSLINGVIPKLSSQ